MKTKDPTASLDVTLKLYYLDPLGCWFADAVNSDGQTIASTHLWESKSDVFNELAMLLAAAEVATA